MILSHFSFNLGLKKSRQNLRKISRIALRRTLHEYINWEKNFLESKKISLRAIYEIFLWIKTIFLSIKVIFFQLKNQFKLKEILLSLKEILSWFKEIFHRLPAKKFSLILRNFFFSVYSFLQVFWPQLTV